MPKQPQHTQYSSSAPLKQPQRKLRLFLIDGDTGQTARHVKVHAWAEFEAMQPDASASKPDSANIQNDILNTTSSPSVHRLGVLQTDHVGYISFDLTSLRDSGKRISALYVAPIARPDTRADVLPALSEGQEAPLNVPLPKLSDIGEQKSSLPAVQSPDAEDWAASPNSFASAGVEVVGQGGCESLLLSNAPIQSYRFTQVLRDPEGEPVPVTPVEPSACEPAPNSGQAPLCYRRGVLLEYEMSWIPSGHGLGEVLYSLPLAPCESVKVAIIDWSRTDAASRGEDMTVAEQLAHNQRRDRAIDEIVHGTVSEWQRGGTVMGAAGGAYSSGNVSLAASVGASYSTSAGDRNAAADTLQRLSDTVGQASSAARRLQSTVVVQASQQETEQLQTRTVKNHNHCHALTVLYYEIVRHFRVRTVLVRARDALLLRYPDQVFDAARALREEQRLRTLIADQSLLAGFAALRRPRGVSPPTEIPENSVIHTLIIKVTTGDEDTGTDESGSYVRYLLMKRDGVIQTFVVTGQNRVTGENWLYRMGCTNTLVFSVPGPPDLTLQDLRQIGVSYHRPGERGIFWRLSGLEFVAGVSSPTGGKDLITLYANSGINHRFTDGSEWWANVNVAGSSATGTDDDRTGQSLLNHLNNNALRYNRALWMSDNPDQVAVLLDRYTLEYGGRRARLLDLVENRPADVVGEYVVFAGGVTELADRLVGEPPRPLERIISVPTRGAFAEVKLSNCNACEVIDDSRFWDWQQSPCPDEATDISPLTAESRAGRIDATPSAVPGATLGVEAPETAPDPTGMSSILDLLGRSEVFRDMSGRVELASVMQSVVNGAVQLQRERIQQEGANERARIQSEQQHEAAHEAALANVDSGAAGGALPTGRSTGARPTSAGGSSGPGASSSSTPVGERERAFRTAENAISRAGDQNLFSPQEVQSRLRAVQDARIQQTIDNPTASSPSMADGENLDTAPQLVNLPETSSRARVSYEPGEADESRTSPGLVTFRSSIERVFYGFQVNEPSATPWLKTEHSAFLSDMILELNLTGAQPRAQIDLIEGYTDLVDTEGVNSPLRRQRAEAVRVFLANHGVPPRLIGRVQGALPGSLLADNQTREARALNRSVLVRIQPILQVELPPERLQPPEHRSTLWALASLGSITLGEVQQGTAAIFSLTDRSLPALPSRYIWFVGPGLGAGGTLPSSRFPRLGSFPRLPGSRPGVSLGLSGTNFRTSVPLRFEDFDGAIGTLGVAQVGFMIGWGVGYTQISGQSSGQRWVGISEDGLLQGTTWIWVGGLQTMNIGADVGGFAGLWTYSPPSLFNPFATPGGTA